MKIGFIGTGTIGSAVYDKWKYEEIVLTERGTKNVDHSGKVVSGNKELVVAVDLIVIAVKPQQWQAVRDELGDLSGKYLISVMAGMTLAQLESTGAKAVRLMPNIAIATEEGACAYAYSDAWSTEEKAAVTPLFEKLGVALSGDEEFINAFIGMSGSGIAYLIAAMGALAAAGEKHGVSPEDARTLLRATACGAAILLKNDDFDTLIKRVACKGGSTEQGLAALKELGVDAAYQKVVERTIKRSEEMGEQFGK